MNSWWVDSRYSALNIKYALWDGAGRTVVEVEERIDVVTFALRKSLTLDSQDIDLGVDDYGLLLRRSADVEVGKVVPFFHWALEREDVSHVGTWRVLDKGQQK